MKKYLYLFLIGLSLLLSSCEGRVVSISELEERNGIY